MLKERSVQHKVNQEAYALVIKDLLDGPATTHELAEVSGLALTTVQSLMRVFVRHKVCHIADWQPDGRGNHKTPVLKLGHGKNKKRPAMDRAEISRNYRLRKKNAEFTTTEVQTKGETHV